MSNRWFLKLDKRQICESLMVLVARWDWCLKLENLDFYE